LLSSARGVIEEDLPGGRRLYFSDSGITSATGESIRFARDAQGRIVSAQAPDGTRLVYAYNATGDLVSAHVPASGQGSRYGYTATEPHQLTLITGNGTGSAVRYGSVTQVLPLTADLGGTAQLVAADYHGQLAAGATDRF